MKTLALLAAVIFAVAACSSGGSHGLDFSIPAGFTSDPDLLPSGWIQRFDVDPAAELTPEQAGQLEALFIAAYDASMQKYRQDYLIPADTRLFRLLSRYRPALDAIPRVEGGHVSLREIAATLRR